MKKEIKGFMMGTIATAVVFTTTLTAFSEPISKTIEATYDNIKIYVDGNLIKPKDANGKSVEPFVSDGTTYLPARAVAEALGKEVSWDDASKSVYIGKKNTDTSSNEYKEVTVSTAEEFVKALGSNRKIIMKPGEYDLSKVYDVNGTGDNVYWHDVYDGKELIISEVSNLTIEGDTSGKVELKTAPRFAEILNFFAGNNINIKNIVAGHTPSQYDCNSGVIGFVNCQSVNITNSEFYGCGSIGITLQTTNDFICDNVKIDHCSLQALSITGSTGVKFTKSSFVDNEAFNNIVYASTSSDVYFEDCLFENNKKLTNSFAELYGNSKITFDNCIIKNNIITNEDTSSSNYTKLSMFKTMDYNGYKAGTITMKDTQISNNTADKFIDREASVVQENCKVENNSWQK